MECNRVERRGAEQGKGDVRKRRERGAEGRPVRELNSLLASHTPEARITPLVPGADRVSQSQLSHSLARSLNPFSATTPLLTSPHLTSPHLTSPHLSLPLLSSPHLTSTGLGSTRLDSTRLPTLHHTALHYTAPHHITLDATMHHAAYSMRHTTGHQATYY